MENRVRSRYIVLTDIHPLGILPWSEPDDIESLHRLLLYSNEIDIEGIIACTSCFLKNGARPKDVHVITDLINTYGQVRKNLTIHAEGYPEASALHRVVCAGISEYGRKPGKGFASAKYNSNPGVNLIIDAVDKDDDRPLWIGLWGGANTLAQAIWKVEQSRSKSDLDRFLRKLRIYSISDQDMSGKWLRDRYGDRLFYIVTPSHGTRKGSRQYYLATWPGISADRNSHGSNDGKRKGGFDGANYDLVSNHWLSEHIISHGIYGAKYPKPVFIMEGDTPAFLGLIPNGLNYPEHPDYGGWGGRFNYCIPAPSPDLAPEKHPVWTSSSDTVIGQDAKSYSSPQATIWRWREAFQHDYAARMDWTISEQFSKANHPPVAKLIHDNMLIAYSGERVELNASNSYDPDGDILSFKWYVYQEAGNSSAAIEINHSHEAVAYFIAPDTPDNLTSVHIHVILEISDNGTPSLTRYQRVIVKVLASSSI